MRHETQTLPKRNGGDVLIKERMILRATFQVVIRNFCIQVVNVVIADIAGKPLHDFWQFIIGTTANCRK